MTMRHVAYPPSQPAELVSQNYLAVVVRGMKEAALTNGMSEPTLDEIKVKYQHSLTKRCAADLQFPTLIIVSPIISHMMSVSGLT